jgi:SAM-dependent methyltransferase
MPIPFQEWDIYYVRQAEQTKGIRYNVYRLIGLANLDRVLEVGSGTGAIAREIGTRCSGHMVALDRDPGLANWPTARENILRVNGDASSLPFRNASFDVVVCHFLLMWLADPVSAVAEMKRVVRPGGWVAVLAEPDYGGWIDYPDEIRVGRMLADALRSEGADPELGRKLRWIFTQAGMEAQIGLSPSMWDTKKLESEFEAEGEWRFKLLGRSRELDEMKERELRAIREGRRILFIPIFWAFARRGGTSEGLP